MNLKEPFLKNYEITGESTQKSSDYFSKKFDNIKSKFKQDKLEFKIDKPNTHIQNKSKMPDELEDKLRLNQNQKYYTNMFTFGACAFICDLVVQVI